VLLRRPSNEVAKVCAASFFDAAAEATLNGELTTRERAIVDRLLQRFPAAPMTAEIREVMKPKGPIEALHLSWSPDITVDIERALIAWPPESPLRMVEAIEAQLELDGLEPSPFSVPPGPGLGGRIAESVRMPFTRFTSLLLRDKVLEGAPALDQDP
jgi:hypothetical protein